MRKIRHFGGMQYDDAAQRSDNVRHELPWCSGCAPVSRRFIDAMVL